MLKNPTIPNLSPATEQQGATKLSDLIGIAIQWLFIAGILIFILFFFISAFKWITSQGDKNSLENARQGLLHAIIGLVVLFALFAIIKLLETVFGVCLFSIQIPVFGAPAGSGRCGFGSPNPLPPGATTHLPLQIGNAMLTMN
jgi:hypothetical protein